MDPSNSLVIETKNLSKAYKGVQALKDLNLKVKQHSIFGFLGPNGAGKTTTIKLLLGLARPTGGSAIVFGQDIQTEQRIHPQEGRLSRSRPALLRVYDRPRDPALYRPLLLHRAKAAIEERIQETLELVGLEDKADRPIKGFSGGERQRLGIAQAQINYPDLLILDEPAASLDPQGRRDVLEVMERLRKYTTIFYSTHILDDVQRVSDTVAILNKGQLVAQAPIEELLMGSGGAAYQLKVKGCSENVRDAVRAQPWVSSLTETPVNGYISWSVRVTDEAAAESNLLRMVLSEPTASVVEFGRQKYNLEEVFLNIVEGDNNGK